MRFFTGAALVVVCVLMVAMAATEGLDDVTGIALLALVLLMGALGVVALRRVGSDDVAPDACDFCQGLNSHHAPYCKHCGLARDHSIEA